MLLAALRPDDVVFAGGGFEVDQHRISPCGRNVCSNFCGNLGGRFCLFGDLEGGTRMLDSHF